MSTFEHGLERTIFASRWLLAPMYVGLLAGLLVVVAKFFVSLWKLISGLTLDAQAEDITVEILSLIDIALLGNLIIIVIFAGYENFVSKINTDNAEDRPGWMGTLDFSGLKMKLIGSIVAISAISLLRAFMTLTDSNAPLDEEVFAQGLEHEKRNFLVALRSADNLEGQAAFLGKRTPNFTGQ